MCEYCNVEPGNVADINLVEDEARLESGAAIIRGEVGIARWWSGEWVLCMDAYSPTGDYTLLSNQTGIRYCPFCGRELKKES